MYRRGTEWSGFRSLFFDGYLLVLLILLVQSFLDIRTLRRAKRVERIAMEPEDKKVREALFGPYTLTEDRKRGLHNQLVIEVHFALSLIASCSHICS